MNFRAYDENNRFAWLTPIQKNTSSNGPWILYENETHYYANNPPGTNRKITVGGLLMLVAGVSGICPAPNTGVNTSEWKSTCSRYKVVWRRNQSDSSRLFVQNRDDYYTRIELYIDGKMAITFQEPVWPHLQHHALSEAARLVIPADCLLALVEGKATYEIPTSSNDGSMMIKNSGDRAA